MYHLGTFFGGQTYPQERIDERGAYGEPLILASDIKEARIKDSGNVWERFADYFPRVDGIYFGEGDTPLLKGGGPLREYTGLKDLRIKDESRNPTGSFKDRGTKILTDIARVYGEKYMMTISTGNMGHSVSAYAANSGGLTAVVVVPDYVPGEKLALMLRYGARVIRIRTKNYSQLKKRLLKASAASGIRISTGNNPFRVEGYKSTAFEIYEQYNRKGPDFIAVPVSACGHIRGLYKGFLELRLSGKIEEIPRFIVVQAERCSPIVSALERRQDDIVSFKKTDTIAHAITSGEPYGGAEIIRLANENKWLYASVSESGIRESRDTLLHTGYDVEYASASVAAALKSLVVKGSIPERARVTAVLTGSGMKEAPGDAIRIPPPRDEDTFFEEMPVLFRDGFIR